MPKELETAILAVLGWTRLWDVPMGGNELTQDQSILVMAILGEPFNSELVYFLAMISVDGVAASRRIATNLDVGVWLPSPVLSSGTNGLTSG